MSRTAIMGEKSYKAFMRRLDALHKKQQKAKKMERKFVGHVINGGPVTMKEAREAGLIKGEPKESTQEELDEAVKTMKDIEEAVEKAREDEGTVVEIVLPKEYEDMEILCPNCNSDDILKTKEGYVCGRCDFQFKIKKDEGRSNS